mmetsp:Transcript_20769/g.49109  ORF Transcript_20769/g.49109 Transcript_20769/m.49109 type:complete len:507 (-) Transcript_20769:107-1627(-)|eukprot:CAMPEP_0197183754 /NCGR_PEP_ID=MMETSP1423-20130617/8198_1 /TAXON_ID=476441 /ORGANISM="Pseudo-nitzschia heimii, Strain UNC1101" /LENGTH=506 /DNA_ID=CAMNT_0042634371 /DNA_START=355 /DNA_END=1875 /DNA_ORIENTATION=-
MTICGKKGKRDVLMKHFSSAKHSWNCGYNSNYESSGMISARSRFKEIPVDPSVLRFIKYAGVGRKGKGGRREKQPFVKKKRHKIGQNNGDEWHKIYDGFDTMNREEERQFFENGRIARRSRTNNSVTKISFLKEQQRKRHSLFALPPPPFGDGRHTRDNRKSNSTRKTKQKARSIRVFPVKLLRRVTSTSFPLANSSDANYQPFPRPMSKFPEVAIIGRSNVGKSTLLNSLLYSGRLIEKEESVDQFRNRRLRSRTRRSQRSKLPKGVKAKTSSKPGETRSIDFYQLSADIQESNLNENDKKENTQSSLLKNNGTKSRNDSKVRPKTRLSLVLVDLPGYGFAFGPKKERRQSLGHKNEEISKLEFLFPWQELIETYITNRPRSSLKRVLLLIDARHGMKKADSHFLKLLQRSLTEKQQSFAKEKDRENDISSELPPLQIVLTKCDLVSQVNLARRVVQVRQQLSDCLIRQPKILSEILVSAQVGQGGILQLQKELASLCWIDHQRL